ncbi:hypothetical protein NE237_012450 [Protea cynaroides]|uniref:Uncharacterized protein n=1 Tax=Protea cynaroides TaxID=273540 RepID=A0A9Q0JY11_9MAGN|nr:hypothetical protein NE237_012450 [Protea cynaroides]
MFYVPEHICKAQISYSFPIVVICVRTHSSAKVLVRTLSAHHLLQPKEGAPTHISARFRNCNYRFCKLLGRITTRVIPPSTTTCSDRASRLLRCESPSTNSIITLVLPFNNCR